MTLDTQAHDRERRVACKAPVAGAGWRSSGAKIDYAALIETAMAYWQAHRTR